MDRVNVVIIGGGVVGCAIARELSRHVQDVFLLEQSPRLGMATSTRNSGVIHSGIYYPPEFSEGALLRGRQSVDEGVLRRARACRTATAGRSWWPRTNPKSPNWRSWPRMAAANGVEGLKHRGAANESANSNRTSGVAAALEVPSTGIVSAEELVKAFARLATDQGASILTNARVTKLEAEGDSIAVGVELGDPGDGEALTQETMEARCVVNSAGLYSDEVAALLGKSQLQNLSRARRICGGGSRPRRSGERAGLSAAASRQAEPGRAPYQARCGARCWSGRPPDTWRTKPTTSATGCRSKSFSRMRAACCRRLKSRGFAAGLFRAAAEARAAEWPRHGRLRDYARSQLPARDSPGGNRVAGINFGAGDCAARGRDGARDARLKARA